MNVESFLPLPQPTLHILIALSDGDAHGYAIMQDVSARTQGKIRLSPGTLYGAIKRLLEDGLIDEVEKRSALPGEDERRRYYRLTKLGRLVTLAELARMEETLKQARGLGLVPKGA
jgi:DNA-binding PadR family transcriptional regulator